MALVRRWFHKTRDEHMQFAMGLNSCLAVFLDGRTFNGVEAFYALDFPVGKRPLGSFAAAGPKRAAAE
jgi:hypothetical protein